MTQTSKAPSDAEIMANYDAMQASMARRMQAVALLDRISRTKLGFAGAKKADLMKIANALGGSMDAGHSRGYMIAFIERSV